jgi:predicted GIY-YIG superfamily endonuclease
VNSNKDCHGEAPCEAGLVHHDFKLRLGRPLMKYYYTYILQSEKDSESFYVGFTEDVKQRLAHHNTGAVPATKPYCPWRLKNYFAFDSEEKARAFERYLKSHSGRAFSKKHF